MTDYHRCELIDAVGFLVVSLLDKSHLHSAFSGDSWGSEGASGQRAKIVLFIGVALMAGGLAGSLVSCRAKQCPPEQ
jgi:hypothetical protein